MQLHSVLPKPIEDQDEPHKLHFSSQPSINLLLRTAHLSAAILFIMNVLAQKYGIVLDP